MLSSAITRVSLNKKQKRYKIDNGLNSKKKFMLYLNFIPKSIFLTF